MVNRSASQAPISSEEAEMAPQAKASSTTTSSRTYRRRNCDCRTREKLVLRGGYPSPAPPRIQGGVFFGRGNCHESISNFALAYVYSGQNSLNGALELWEARSTRRRPRQSAMSRTGR